MQKKETAVKRQRGRPSSEALVGTDILLQTARGVFARRGYEGATLRAIAQESCTDPALVAHHFGSKQALWIAVVDQIAGQMSTLITLLKALRKRADLSAKQRVEQAMREVIRLSFLHPDIGMFFATAATEDEGRQAFLTERLSRPFHEALVPLLQDAMRAREIPRQDPHILHSILAQGIFQTISYSHVLRSFSPLPGKPKQFEAAVLKTILLLLG